MDHIAHALRRRCAPAPAAVLLLALCLLVVGVQAMTVPPGTGEALPVLADANSTSDPALVISAPGRYTLDHDFISFGSIGVLINSSDVVLDGMGHSIEGTDATGSTGVVVGGISPEPRVVNVTVRNLTVRHWNSGICVVRANGSVIEYVVSEQNSVGLLHGGLESLPSENGVVRDSVFRNNTLVGISLGYPFGGIAIERCRVTGNGRGMNVAVGPGTYDTYRGSPSLVADCDISDNQDYGLEIREDGYSFRQGLVSAVRNCTIRGNGGDGVVVERTTTEIVGNRVEENGGYGVNAGDGGGSNITSNRIAGNRYGVSAGGDWPSRVRNNLLNNTDNGNFGAPLDDGYLNFTKTAGTNIVGGPYLGGNVWAFPNGTGFSQTHPDTDNDGFCDDAFVTSQGAVDYLPLAMPAVAAVPGGTGRPTSTAGNGLCDDVNGNGRTDFADIVLYFNQMSWIAANEPTGLFDYNGNGRIDFGDVVWLFNHLGGPAETTFTVRAVAIGPGEIVPSGNVTVPEGGNVTFSLESRSELPTPYSTQSGYYVHNEIFVDPTVVPTPHPTIAPYGPGSFTPSYTLSNVRSDHTVYAVFYYTMVIA